MATTGIVNSTAMAVYINTTGTTYVKIAYATDASISISSDMRDITTKDSAAWREVLPGLRSATISISALYEMQASTQGVHATTKPLWGALDGRTSVTVRFMTAVTGDQYFTVTGYISSLELNSPGNEDNATYSCTIEATGAVLNGTVS